jgi:hypothetical protein
LEISSQCASFVSQVEFGAKRAASDSKSNGWQRGNLVRSRQLVFLAGWEILWIDAVDLGSLNQRVTISATACVLGATPAASHYL